MKKTLSVFLVFSILFFNVVHSQDFSNQVKQSIQQFDINTNTSIRAIAAINDSTCWFVGSNGTFGYTENGGKNWIVDSIKIDTIKPEFRAIAALNSNTILILCIGSPAYMLKTIDKGKTWRIVYKNNHPNIFFDAMKFRDQQNGIAVADPIDSCFVIIKTTDGGENWKQIECSKIPKALDGEACFASSNTNVEFIGKQVWIATGGKYSRILKSNDNGQNWKAYTNPIISGNQMTGVYTMDFLNPKTGIIAGGNYDAKENTTNNKAISNDGGKTWNITANDNPPGFVSCIQYSPDENGKTILASCLPGIFISDDHGKSWKCIDAESKFYTLKFSLTGNVAWFAGAKGKLARMDFDKNK